MTARKISLLMAAVLGISATANLGSQEVLNCNVYNQNINPTPYGSNGWAEHPDHTTSHYFNSTVSGSCQYTGTAAPYNSVPCNGTATANASASGGDNGSYHILPRAHLTTYNQKQASSSSNGGQAVTATSEAAAATESCSLNCSSGITISFGAGTPAGYSITYSQTPIWSDQYTKQVSCQGYTLPSVSSWTSCPTPIGSPSGPPAEGMQWSWSYTACAWVQIPNNSPVIVDTTNTGFKLSDVIHGEYVTFDIRGNGQPLKLSWPLPGSGNAWLALDRDGDGVIKDGTELFGNFTPHADAGIPNNQYANGFSALDWYDQPAQGGNQDAILDKRDAIWPKLRLWIDEHCYKAPDVPCQSLPSELHTLESKGITSISMMYQGGITFDKIGNKFAFHTVINPLSETVERDENGHSCCMLQQRSKDPRLIYDVFLKSTD